MILPLILSSYIIRQMFKSFFIVGFGLFTFIALLDFVELLSKTNKLNISFDSILYMEFLKLFDILHSIFPYMTMFSIMHAFYSLNKDKEITVARSTGISGLQIIIPAMVFAFTLGLFQTFILNHLAVTTYNQYTVILSEKQKKVETIIDIRNTGIWLREGTNNGYRIINGTGFQNDPFSIDSANIFELSLDNKFLRSYSADKIVLQNGSWKLYNSYTASQSNSVEFKKQHTIGTETTYSTLKNMFKSPSDVSFWHLPQQIYTLKSIGLNSVQYVYMFNFLLSLPILFVGIAMIAGYFTGRPYARQPKNKSIVLGVGIAFALFFYLNLIKSIADALPFSPVFSGWIPALSTLVLGIYLTLNSEKVEK